MGAHMEWAEQGTGTWARGSKAWDEMPSKTCGCDSGPLCCTGPSLRGPHPLPQVASSEHISTTVTMSKERPSSPGNRSLHQNHTTFQQVIAAGREGPGLEG